MNRHQSAHFERSRAPFLGLLAGAALIGVSLGACTLTISEGDPIPFNFDAGSREAASPTPSATGAPTNLACNGCLFQGCSGQHAVCQASSECLAIYQCATKVGCDQACVNSCFESHPAGQKEYTALYTGDAERSSGSCKAHCQPTSCLAPTDEDAAAPAPDAQVPLDCSGCTTARCASQQAACAAGSDCDLYTGCVLGCADAACGAKCSADRPAGKAASEALAACTGASCKVECGF